MDATTEHSGNRLGGGTSAGRALGILDGSGTTMPKPTEMPEPKPSEMSASSEMSTELPVHVPTEVNCRVSTLARRPRRRRGGSEP